MIPIGNSPFGVRLGNFSNYNITNSVISGFKNTTTTLSQSNEISLEFDIDSAFFEIGAGIDFSNPTNSLSFAPSQPFFTQEYFIDAEIELPWNMMIWTESSYTINTGRSSDYDISFLIINCGIEKRFTNKENIILSIEGNDILNQNIIALRQIQNNLIIDNMTTIISRYFLARLTYRFNNNNNSIKKDEKFH